MNREIRYRSLRCSDMGKVVKLHRASFPPEHLRRTIFYSPRVARYLASLISYPELQRNHQFLGAWADDNLVAYAHYRTLEGSLHLNQVVVHPEYQGKGIGRHLVQEWKRTARELGLPYVSLDVEADNARAYSWYLRLGLSPISKAYLYEREIAPTLSRRRSADFRLVDWENTVAWQTAYGFATIRIEFEHQVFEVGWVGKTLRIGHPFPQVLLSGLLCLVPNVKWLLLRSSEPAAELSGSRGDWKLAAVTVRMQGRLSREEVK